MGRLAKHLAKRYNTPLVILSIHGSYLTNPFWDEEHTRRGRITAEISPLFTAEELLSLDESFLQQAIENALCYDEYAWQEENKIRDSLQTEYNYKDFNPTELQFMAEYLSSQKL